MKLMERKLDELNNMPLIDAKEVYGLTQIARAISVIDKQIKDYPEDDPLSELSEKELLDKAKAAIG